MLLGLLLYRALKPPGMYDNGIATPERSLTDRVDISLSLLRRNVCWYIVPVALNKQEWFVETSSIVC